MTRADRVPAFLPNHFWSQQYSRPLLHSPKKSHIYLNVVVSKVSRRCCHTSANTKKSSQCLCFILELPQFGTEYCGLRWLSIFVLTILLLSQRKKGQIWEKLNSDPVNIIVTSKLWRIYWITFVLLVKFISNPSTSIWFEFVQFLNVCWPGVQASGGPGGDFQDEEAACRVP